jgi:hypothetical protein
VNESDEIEHAEG